MECIFEVTQDCIDRGHKDDPESCPIALAVKQKFCWPKVGQEEGQVEFDHEGETYKACLPLEAINFYESFDDDGEVKPFTFKVNAYPVEEFEAQYNED